MGECQVAAEPIPASRAVILVVEDEVMLRLAASYHLRGAGFTVIEAANADEAVRVVGASKSIALVFSDLTMPGEMDGYALARWISREHPHIKVLMTSALE